MVRKLCTGIKGDIAPVGHVAQWRGNLTLPSMIRLQGLWDWGSFTP